MNTIAVSSAAFSAASSVNGSAEAAGAAVATATAVEAVAEGEGIGALEVRLHAKQRVASKNQPTLTPVVLQSFDIVRDHFTRRQSPLSHVHAGACVSLRATR
jgi:hypothetical protein